jgi:hypothetical protein
MKAMLEPRIAAVRIHGPAAGGQGEAAGFDAIEASSQGCLKIVAIARTECHIAQGRHWSADDLSIAFGPDERSISQVGERLFDLFFCVHDERTITRDGLPERLRRDQQETNRLIDSRRFYEISVAQHCQRCL